MTPPYVHDGHAESSSIPPFDSTYGNLIANVTLSAGTDYRVNITDKDNNVLISALKNGDAISMGAFPFSG
jgi:hypothetical protein